VYARLPNYPVNALANIPSLWGYFNVPYLSDRTYAV
jgi:hypothetical protein